MDICHLLNRCRKVWISYCFTTHRSFERSYCIPYQMIEKEIRENMEKLEGLEYRIAKCRCFQWVRAISFFPYVHL